MNMVKIAIAAAAAAMLAGCSSAPVAGGLWNGPGRARNGAADAAPGFASREAAERYAEAISADFLAAVTAERFPDADTAAVFQWEETRYEADGTYETTWTSIDKILTDRGLEQNESHSIWNNDFYGSVTVLVARVHSAGGAVRDIDLAENLAEAIDTGALASNIHDPNDKTWTLAFPGLEVGDTVETTVRRTTVKPRAEGVYADWLTFEQTSPVLWQGVRIDGPSALPLAARALRDADAIAIEHAAETNAALGRIAETWIVPEETPRFFPEPDMPPAHTCTARLMLSTAENWEALSRWYAKLCAPRLAATNAAMAALVADLRGDAAERSDAVRALFDFVSRDVRYMGAMAESEAPGYEPHDVSLTFDNRYGVCRDKAALLVALLRMAGIEAWPALVHVGERKDPDVPQPYFNHAIVAVASGDPSDPYVMMDPTSETTRSLLPEYLCEKSYLVAREEGETIRETPPLPAGENLLKGETTLRFADENGGGAAGETTLSFCGINDVAYRGRFASAPRDSIRAFCQRMLSTAFPGAILAGWALSPDPAALRTDLSPLSLTLSYEIPAAVSPLDPPRMAEALAVSSHIVGNLGLEKRRFPLVTEYPCGFSETVKFEGRTPEPMVETSLRSGAVRYEDRLEGDTLVRSMQLMKSRFSSGEYAELRALRESEERSDRSPVFFAGDSASGAARPSREALAAALEKAVAPQPEDDIYLERARVAIDLGDMPRSWSVTTTRRERILSYAGQRKAADVAFAWQPAVEDFELVEAKITAPDGTETPVNPALDIFDGDQDDVADAPRYPAGRLKTVSFPKVGPGSTVEYTVRRRIFGKDFFSAFCRLGRYGSFGEDAVEVRGPEKWRSLFSLHEPRWRGLVATNAVERIDGADCTVWRLAGGGPQSVVASEGNPPDAYDLFPTVEAAEESASGRARAIRDAFEALSDPRAETNAAALALSLVPAGAGVAEKVRAVRDWTDLNLRAAGPAWTSLPLSSLSRADETLAFRYGHAADRQILRLAMARALGLKPALRFYCDGWDAPGEADPLSRRIGPESIDAVSIAVDGEDGRTYFLDGSSRFSPLPFDAHQGRAFAALPLREQGAKPEGGGEGGGEGGEGGEVGFSRLSGAPDFGEGDDGLNASETYRVCSLRADGSARVEVRERFRGVAATALRRKYSQILPEERRRDAQRTAAAFSQSAALVGDIEVSCGGDGACERSYALEVPDFAVRRGDGSLVLRVERTVLSPESAPRRFPFLRSATLRSRESTILQLPDGWRVSSRPADGGVWHAPEFGIKLERSVSEGGESGAALRVCDTLCLGPAEFPPERYLDFLAGELETQGAATDTVVVAPVEK